MNASHFPTDSAIYRLQDDAVVAARAHRPAGLIIQEEDVAQTCLCQRWDNLRPRVTTIRRLQHERLRRLPPDGADGVANRCRREHDRREARFVLGGVKLLGPSSPIRRTQDQRLEVAEV